MSDLNITAGSDNTLLAYVVRTYGISNSNYHRFMIGGTVLSAVVSISFWPRKR